MLFLGLVICVTAFLVSLLPRAPIGLPYAALLLLVTLIYPLLLARTLRLNRADYEFRAMHWFPFGIVVLWGILEFLGPRARVLHVFRLGFFFLWSLPLAALGLAFLILFSLHVIRRSRIRITTLSILLALFTAGAVMAEGMHWNPAAQRTIYPATDALNATLVQSYGKLRGYLGMLSGTSSSDPVIGGSSSSTSSSQIAMVSSSLASSRASVIAQSSLSSSRPTNLPKSGPESVALIFTTLSALYMGTLHGRAKKRI